MLRRLAIHATDVSARQDLSADDKVAWLLERCDVNEPEARHEIFRMARKTYRELSRQKREALIQAIISYQLTGNTFTNNDAQLARYRFDWFYWLLQADPDCELVKREFDIIQEQYPEFQSRQYPDLPHGWLVRFTTQSPWSVEKLLAKPASEWLSSLLNYRPSQEEQALSRQSRRSLLLDVKQAAKDKTAWGLDLANAMAEKSQWESDLVGNGSSTPGKRPILTKAVLGAFCLTSLKMNYTITATHELLLVFSINLFRKPMQWTSQNGLIRCIR